MRTRSEPSGFVECVDMPGLSFQSLALGVARPLAPMANCAWCARLVATAPQSRPCFRAMACSGVPPGVFAVGVPQPASTECAAVQRSFVQPLRSASFAAPSNVRTDLSPSFAPVVGQPVSGNADEVEALTDVRRTDARSAQISSPEGVARALQVSAYSVEPREAVR